MLAGGIMQVVNVNNKKAVIIDDDFWKLLIDAVAFENEVGNPSPSMLNALEALIPQMDDQVLTLLDSYICSWGIEELYKEFKSEIVKRQLCMYCDYCKFASGDQVCMNNDSDYAQDLVSDYDTCSKFKEEK